MTVVSTTAGSVRGSEKDGHHLFAGVPFAAPPVGELRWRPPAPVEPWEGERDATSFGATAPQNVDMMSMLLGLEAEPRSEDCLFLNVWTPAPDDAKRPVMVWIHGGAFMIGSGSMPLYDASTFVDRSDVVVVTINYRLGELGFLELGAVDPDYAGSGNAGLLDQVAALEWVRDNIAAFGGDPDCVTIFGESAGAMSVSALLAMPAARGLFHRAIAQSGAGQAVASKDHAEEAAASYMARVGASTIEDMLALSVDQMMEAQSAIYSELLTDPEVMLQSGDPMAGIPFRPCVDGVVIPEPVETALRAGSSADVPLLVGTNRDEWKLFDLMDPVVVDEEELLKRFEAMSVDRDKTLAAYREAYPDLDPKGLFSAFMTDSAFRVPAIRLAAAQLEATDQVWTYWFTWGTPALAGALGSCHAIEIPFVFDVVDDPKLATFVGTDAPVGLADRMQDAWIAFARTGRPSADGLPDWPAYDLDRRATMQLDAESQVVEDPGAGLRQFWESAAS